MYQLIGNDISEERSKSIYQRVSTHDPSYAIFD